MLGKASELILSRLLFGLGFQLAAELRHPGFHGIFDL
jgi:hypothetical protein